MRIDWEALEAGKCSNCHLRHEGPCPFILGQPCLCCGEPVREISTAGDRVCAYCDTGRCYEKPKTPKCTETYREMERKYLENIIIQNSRN